MPLATVTAAAAAITASVGAHVVVVVVAATEQLAVSLADSKAVVAALVCARWRCSSCKRSLETAISARLDQKNSFKRFGGASASCLASELASALAEQAGGRRAGGASRSPFAGFLGRLAAAAAAIILFAPETLRRNILAEKCARERGRQICICLWLSHLSHIAHSSKLAVRPACWPAG